MKTNQNHSESLLVHFQRAEALRKEAMGFKSLNLNRRQLCDLELLLNRAFYPLDGYLRREDYESVLDAMRLGDGTIWPIPICLDVDQAAADGVEPGQPLALRDEEGFLLAVLRVTGKWPVDRAREAEAVYGSLDPKVHAGVRGLYEDSGDWYLSGQVEGISQPLHYGFLELRLTPADTHRKFSLMGWRKVAAFHCERPVMRPQMEASLAAAREVGANILLQPVVAPESPGDSYNFTAVRCYQQILKEYPKNLAMLGILPLKRRLAGPRSALWHALICKNFGCSHIMVAPDHADPWAVDGGGKHFYARGAAHELVAEHAADTGIEPVLLKEFAYAGKRGGFVPLEDGKAGEMEVVEFPELISRLERGLDVPPWLSSPEIIEELRWFHRPRHRQGLVVFFTGLSGAGKSTLAKALAVKFLEMRTRAVTLLDGDIVRKHLSSELSFSREHRDLNVVRIGFVAKEIARNGGVAICAPIAPYELSRRQVREMVVQAGGFIEIYVSTPLEICEERDRKGMYAKARAGKIRGFTGVDDPYEKPENPELILDASKLTPEEGVQEILRYLAEEGYIK